MNDIIKLANKLADIRVKEAQAKEILDAIKQKKDEIQMNLIEVMRDSGLKSLKTDTHNFARTIKKDLRVVDEQVVMKNLPKEEYDFYVKPKLDTIAFKSYAKSVMNETGEILDGVEPVESEYMSIKKVK